MAKKVTATALINEELKNMPATADELVELTGLKIGQVRGILSVLQSVGYVTSERDKGTGLLRYRIA